MLALRIVFRLFRVKQARHSAHQPADLIWNGLGDGEHAHKVRADHQVRHQQLQPEHHNLLKLGHHIPDTGCEHLADAPPRHGILLEGYVGKQHARIRAVHQRHHRRRQAYGQAHVVDLRRQDSKERDHDHHTHHGEREIRDAAQIQLVLHECRDGIHRGDGRKHEVQEYEDEQGLHVTDKMRGDVHQFVEERHHRNRDDHQHCDHDAVGRKRGRIVPIRLGIIAFMVCDRDEAPGHRIQRDGKQLCIAYKRVRQSDEPIGLSTDVTHDIWREHQTDSNGNREIHQACDHVHKQLFLISHNSTYYSPIVSTNSR